MTERKRQVARYQEDQFVFTPSGVRVSDLTDEQLLAYDPSRAPKPPPLPGQPTAEPDTS